MLAPALAANQIFPDRGFTIQVIAISTVALALSVPLRRSRINRLTVNSIAVLLCALIGLLELGGWRVLPALKDWRQWAATVQDADTMRLLVRAFIWIMAFRALTVRTQRDLALTTVPSISALVLVTVLRADLGAVVWLAAFLLGALWLFAMERSAELRERAIGESAPAPGLRPSARAPVRSLLTTYLVSVTGGIIICLTLMQFALPRELAGRLRLELAQRVAQWLIQTTKRVYTAPSARVDLKAPAPQLSSKVVFYVTCDRDLLWRLEAYDVYDGRFWRRAQTRGTAIEAAAGVLRLPLAATAPGDSDRGTIQVRQAFEVAAPLHGALIAAYRPTALAGAGPRAHVDYLANLKTSRTLTTGDQYFVTSAVKRAFAPTDPTARIPEEVRARCLLIAPAISTRTRDLARRIVGDEGDLYARARAIQTHLEQHYAYDPHAPAPPRGQDPLDHFLFRSKRGYCNHFATAMAILCRVVGVPTRLAVGFGPGEVEDSAEDRRAVRESDGHSWVEAYIPGTGWMTFDPTDGARQARLTGFAAAYDRASQWWRGVVTRFPVLRLQSLRRLAVGALAVLTVLSALAAAWRVSRCWRARQPRPSPGDWRGRVTFAYRRACAALAWAGLVRPPAATALEFARLGQEALGTAWTDLHDLTRHYVLAVYGTGPVPPDAAAAAERSARALRAEALRLRLRRAFRLPRRD